MTTASDESKLPWTTLLLVLDFIGTFVFAIEGGVTAANAGLDLLGIFVLAYVTAVGGGILRDLLIGATPPNAIRDWRYAVIALAGCAAVFFALPVIGKIPPWLLMGLDAAGLGLFAVAGTLKALEYGIHPLVAILLASVTGSGGGVIRDICLARVPTVLRTDIYAVAALLAGVIVVVGLRLTKKPLWPCVIGAVFCFGLRVVAVSRGWSLPRVH